MHAAYTENADSILKIMESQDSETAAAILKALDSEDSAASLVKLLMTTEGLDQDRQDWLFSIATDAVNRRTVDFDAWAKNHCVRLLNSEVKDSFPGYPMVKNYSIVIERCFECLQWSELASEAASDMCAGLFAEGTEINNSPIASDAMLEKSKIILHFSLAAQAALDCKGKGWDATSVVSVMFSLGFAKTQAIYLSGLNESVGQISAAAYGLMMYESLNPGFPGFQAPAQT